MEGIHREREIAKAYFFFVQNKAGRLKTSKLISLHKKINLLRPGMLDIQLYWIGTTVNYASTNLCTVVPRT
jgi:hypothetical protein